MARIRQGNVAMALVVIVAAALWMTPVLNAQRISAQSQLTRFLDGTATVDQVPFWHLAHDWGTAGEAALERLAAASEHPDAVVIAERIKLVRAAGTPFQFNQSQLQDQAVEKALRLAEMLPVLPQGRAVTPEFFANVPPYRVEQWLQGCARGDSMDPGCVLIFADLLPGLPPGAQAVVIHRVNGARSEAVHVRRGTANSAVLTPLFNLGGREWPNLPADAPARILSGEFSIEPSGLSGLRFDGMLLVPDN